MLPKELFLSTISKIQKQEKRMNAFSKALSKVCDGFPVFDKNNLYLEALFDLLKHTMQDKYDNISWWLYEAPESGYTISWEENGEEVSVDLTDAGTLYDYLVESAMQREALRQEESNYGSRKETQ